MCSLTVAYNELRSYERGVAQLGSAGALGALGRRFESCRPDSIKTKSYKRVSQALFFIAFFWNNETERALSEDLLYLAILC